MTRTRAVLIALVASTALLLSGCGFGPIAMDKSVDIIYHVEFSQSQAVLGFDDATYTLEEGDAELEAFRELLTKHGVEPWNYRPRETDGCTGGVTTRVHLLYHGAGEDDMTIDGCAADDGSFEAEATELFTDARIARGQAAIVSLNFTQTQAVQGFDDGSHTQDDPAEIARFTELLERYGVTPGQPIAVEPCPGSIATQVAVIYAGMSIQPVMDIDSCTDDDGFSAAATDLFSEWREAG